MVKIDDVTSIASSAILGSLSVSCWVGRKKDKTTEAEVQQSKGAGSARAASVYKNLFAESQELKAVITYGQDCSRWFASVTIPWDDNGTRLIPTEKFFEIDAEIADRRNKYAALVQVFLNNYTTLVSKQAFMLGSMFDRSEFPDASEVAQKFGFRFNTMPVPLAGDFRVDIGNEGNAMLAERCEAEITRRITAAVMDVYERVSDEVEHIRERMQATLEYTPGEPEEIKEYDDDGNVVALKLKKTRKPKLYQTLLDNGLMLCENMRTLNITNDPILEQVRAKLHQSLIVLDIDSLRDSPDMQVSVKKKMEDIQDILGKFSFGE